METLVVQPKTKEQLAALKAVIKALKINFKSEESPYDPEFVEKFYRAEKILRMEKV